MSAGFDLHMLPSCSVVIVNGFARPRPRLWRSEEMIAARESPRALSVPLGLAARPPLLGSPDFQSLADLANAVSVVKGMRWITVGPRLLTIMILAVVGPLMPLFLFRYPLAELAQKFFSRLVGF